MRNLKDYVVEAKDWNEAFEKWNKGLTVGEEERRKEETLNADDYTIKVEGNKTIVTTKDGKVGIARCNPEDTFDIVEGIRVALEDIKKKYRKLTKEELAIIHYLQEMGCSELDIQELLGMTYIRGSKPDATIVIAGVVQQHNEFDWLNPLKWYTINDILEQNK